MPCENYYISIFKCDVQLKVTLIISIEYATVIFVIKSCFSMGWSFFQIGLLNARQSRD